MQLRHPEKPTVAQKTGSSRQVSARDSQEVYPMTLHCALSRSFAAQLDRASSVMGSTRRLFSCRWISYGKARYKYLQPIEKPIIFSLFLGLGPDCQSRDAKPIVAASPKEGCCNTRKLASVYTSHTAGLVKNITR